MIITVVAKVKGFGEAVLTQVSHVVGGQCWLKLRRWAGKRVKDDQASVPFHVLSLVASLVAPYEPVWASVTAWQPQGSQTADIMAQGYEGESLKGTRKKPQPL